MEPNCYLILPQNVVGRQENNFVVGNSKEGSS